jgi:two-component system NtrC family sensor kinase
VKIYAFPPIIAAVAYLLVGLLVYSKKRPNPVNKSFAIMLLCVSLWNIDWAGLISAPSANFAEQWGSIFRIPLLFIPPTFLHFAFLFTNPQGFSRRIRKILFIFYSLSCFLAAFSWTRYFVKEVIVHPWGYSFKGGPLYLLFLLQFILAIVIAFSYMLRGYTSANRYHRHRLKYFFLAVGVSFTLGSLNFLPIFGMQVYPFGSIAVTVGLFIATYSVVQHRLMDVSVFMAKGLAYIFTILILGGPAAVAMIFLEKYYFQQMDLSFSLLLLTVGITAALIFHKVKERMNQAMQQIIVRDKYFYHRVLEDFSRRLVTMVDLNRLLRMLADTVERSMGVSTISIFLYYPEKEIFRLALTRGSSEDDLETTSFNSGDPCIHWLEEKKEAVVRAEIDKNPRRREEKEFLNMMMRLQAEVCLPLIYLDRLIGFINLGHKMQEEMYYREDLDLLNTLANQLAIAIENANLYENLKKSQDIMRRADRLASLGTLVSSLAHEIRNPLVSIKTFTQLLPERLEDEEFRNYFLKVASGEIDRLTTLINELLGFARPSEPNLRGEDVNTLIDKIEFLIATEARKKSITISKNRTPNLPLVMVDAEQIKQVLLNLLLNAIQAIPREGEIWVETRVVQVPRNETNERFVQIEVRDTGVGIPKENLERVFDPFFSTRPDGSGLGLAISYQIIHEHGGFIDLESEVGKGTSFRIHLPLKGGGQGGHRG